MRNVLVTIACALLASASLAEIIINQPRVGDEEFAGERTAITFIVPPGLDSGGVVLDGDILEVCVDLVDDAGAVLYGPYELDTPSGPVDYNNAFGNVDVLVELGDLSIATELSDPLVSGVRLKIRTTNGAPGQFAEAAFDPKDESVDEVLSVVLPSEAPRIVSAVVDYQNDTLRVEFSRPMNVGSSANLFNQTNIVGNNVNGMDFQTASALPFDGTEATVGGLSNARFIGVPPFTTILFDYAHPKGQLEPVAYLRPSYNPNGSPASTNSFRDITGYRALPNELQLMFVGAPCESDLNDDGVVNSSDLAVLLAGWGECP